MNEINDLARNPFVGNLNGRVETVETTSATAQPEAGETIEVQAQMSTSARGSRMSDTDRQRTEFDVFYGNRGGNGVLSDRREAALYTSSGSHTLSDIRMKTRLCQWHYNDHDESIMVATNVIIILDVLQTTVIVIQNRLREC